MRLPLPYVLLGAILAALGIYFYGHHKGWTERDGEMQVEIARKNDEARTKETRLREQLANKSTELNEANDVIFKKQTALDRAISAGRVRLPATRCVQASPGAAPADGGRDEARGQSDRQADAAADADRETLRLIAQIAADGDRAVNQLNACIDAYNEMKETVNGQR